MAFQLMNVYEKPEEFVTVAGEGWDIGDLRRIAQLATDITRDYSREDSSVLMRIEQEREVLLKKITDVAGMTVIRFDENEVPTGIRRDIFEELRRMLITSRDKLSQAVEEYNSGKLSDRDTIRRVEDQVLRYNIAEHTFLRIFGEDAL